MPLILAILVLFAVVPQTVAASGIVHAKGSASWYALDGNRTANGEIFRSAKMTAAHRSLPMGTKVRVTNLNNGKSVVVRINDRGPFAKGRILDVSKGAARKLGFLGRGHTNVRVARVAKSTPVGTAIRYKRIAKTVLPKKRPAAALWERLASLR